MSRMVLLCWKHTWTKKFFPVSRRSRQTQSECVSYCANITSRLAHVETAQNGLTRCHPSRKFTRLHPCFPDHSSITFSTSAPLAIIQSPIRPRCPWQVTDYSQARGQQRTPIAHTWSTYTYIYTHINAHGVGSNVAFYEPPTSELGQPRPRVSQPWKHAEFSGSNGILVTDTENWYVCVFKQERLLCGFRWIYCIFVGRVWVDMRYAFANCLIERDVDTCLSHAQMG